MSDHHSALSISELAMHAEAFLFVEGGALSTKKLAHALGIDQARLPEVLDQLEKQLEGRALSLVRAEGEVTLAVSGAVSPAVREAFQRELGKEVGDAGLEVLSVLLYGGPATRARIDYIRGVNTSSTVRLLMSRGLIERTGNPDDAREYVYRPTAELLAHLGVTKVQDLPEYATIARELASFEQERHEGGPFQSHHVNAAADTPDNPEL
jgi:segregation and condensation protein B